MSTVSKDISRAFRQKQEPIANSWKECLADLIEFYWREFAKNVIWEPGNDTIIWKAWGRIAGKRYVDWMYKLGKKKKCPNWCSPEAWESWMAYKQTTHAKANGVIKAANCKGHSGEPSVHVGGSKSFLGRAVTPTKKRPICLPFLYNLNDASTRRRVLRFKIEGAQY